jgi:hypothetical protein
MGIAGVKPRQWVCLKIYGSKGDLVSVDLQIALG